MILQNPNYINEEYKDMLSITFELSYICDKSCWYCYNPNHTHFGNDESAKDQIWSYIMNYPGPLQVLLMGGETTLYEKSIQYFNEYCLKYKNDPSKHIIYFSHGNSNLELYSKFDSYQKQEAYISLSFHSNQTKEKLWWEVLDLLKLKNNIVACTILFPDNQKDLDFKFDLLNSLVSKKIETDIFLYQKNDEHQEFQDLKRFSKFKYISKIYKAIDFLNKSEIIFSKSKEQLKYFLPNGLTDIKKICWNKYFVINPNGILQAECLYGPTLDLNLSTIEQFNDFVSDQKLTCSVSCTTAGLSTNKKYLFANNLKQIGVIGDME